MIKSDFHIHTTFSTDGQSDMESVITSAIERGLEEICFTEHNDYGVTFNEGPGAFIVDTDAYFEKYRELSAKYEGKIRLRFGVEIGLLNETGIPEHFRDYTTRFPFDFIIGSSHIAGKLDPYLPEYWKAFEDQDQACRFYFEEELACIRKYDCFDAYGHLDYALRYTPQKLSENIYDKCADVLDELLKNIIAKGKVIEINSKGLRTSLNSPNPALPVIRRYRELGGPPPSIGSDSHEISELAYGFPQIEALLKECGYDGYSVFTRRKREDIPFNA